MREMPYYVWFGPGKEGKKPVQQPEDSGCMLVGRRWPEQIVFLSMPFVVALIQGETVSNPC